MPAKIATLMALIAFGLPAAAAVEAGVKFQERVSLGLDQSGDGETLELCATGLMRYRRIFKGYAAALYRGDCSAAEDPLANSPKRLELSYFWSIDGKLLGDAAESSLRENLPPEVFATLETRMKQLHASYLPVAPGDRYALTYVPSRGTELALNGRSVARIEGEDFARAYFGIWLGAKPIDENLRNALLARSTRR